MKLHANGKLLITGEYLVLNGAKALAIPLNKGQGITVEEYASDGLKWTAKIPNAIWFEAEFDKQFNIKETNSLTHAKKLQSILKRSVQINPLAEEKLLQKQITTQLEFAPDWGWGSSSTLISLLSHWLEIDPYQLLQDTFGGSGYDIACANHQQPIIYQRLDGASPIIEPVRFQPPFIEQIGVLWLNKKQTSSVEVKKFLKEKKPDSAMIKETSQITEELTKTNDFHQFYELMKLHEQIIARATSLTPIQNLLFPNFPGTIKSLGAWGGDFVMFVSQEPFNSSAKWFSEKGYNTLFKLKDVMR